MFVEARSVDLSSCPVVEADLLNGLPYYEKHITIGVFRVYLAEDAGTQLQVIIRGIDTLGDKILEGYPQWEPPEEWKKKSQQYIEWLAGPKVGRDRLSIAFAYLRSAFVTHSWADLRESRNQFEMLYNVIAPVPFEF